jgi:hypothetical protein
MRIDTDDDAVLEACGEIAGKCGISSEIVTAK